MKQFLSQLACWLMFLIGLLLFVDEERRLGGIILLSAWHVVLFAVLWSDREAERSKSPDPDSPLWGEQTKE